MPALPTITPARHGVVTLAELLGAGWTRDAIRHALRTGALERVATGRFAPPPRRDLNSFRQAEVRLLRRAIAATVPGDRVAVSHLAAALHRDWPVWASDPGPCVSTWDPRVRRAPGDPTRPFALDREKERQEALADVDLEVVRWGARDLRDFSTAAARIERARVRARRKLTDGPPRWIARQSLRPDVRVSGAGSA